MSALRRAVGFSIHRAALGVVEWVLNGRETEDTVLYRYIQIKCSKDSTVYCNWQVKLSSLVILHPSTVQPTSLTCHLSPSSHFPHLSSLTLQPISPTCHPSPSNPLSSPVIPHPHPTSLTCHPSHSSHFPHLSSLTHSPLLPHIPDNSSLEGKQCSLFVLTRIGSSRSHTAHM